jgi:hypothetical protein
MPMFSDEVEVKLRDQLTPSEIAKIKYPDHPETAVERDDDVRKKALGDKRKRLTATLEKACLAGDLKYEGEPVYWVNEIIPNSLPKYPPPGSHIEPQTYKKLIPSTIKIHFSEFAKFVDGDEKWFPEGFWQELINLWIVKELVAEGDGDDGTTGKKKAKGETDKLRTLHFIDWVKRNNYDGKNSNYFLQDELRNDNPALWGKNIETFNKWLQTKEAKQAKELLDKLKLDARLAL